MNGVRDTASNVQSGRPRTGFVSPAIAAHTRGLVGARGLPSLYRGHLPPATRQLGVPPTAGVGSAAVSLASLVAALRRGATTPHRRFHHPALTPSSSLTRLLASGREGGHRHHCHAPHGCRVAGTSAAVGVPPSHTQWRGGGEGAAPARACGTARLLVGRLAPFLPHSPPSRWGAGVAQAGQSPSDPAPRPCGAPRGATAAPAAAEPGARARAPIQCNRPRTPGEGVGGRIARPPRCRWRGAHWPAGAAPPTSPRPPPPVPPTGLPALSTCGAGPPLSPPSRLHGCFCAPECPSPLSVGGRGPPPPPPLSHRAAVAAGGEARAV